MRRRLRSYIPLVILLCAIAIAGVLLESPSADPASISLRPDAHSWFGTSPYGHQMWRLLLFAVASAAAQACWAAGITLGIATVIGFTSAFAPGRIFDKLQTGVSRLLDSVGLLIMGMCVLAVLPHTGRWSLGMILASVAWPSMANVIRGETVSELRADYIEAARALGVGPLRLFAIHLVPAIWPRLQSLFFGLVTGFIAVFAALAFLGAGSATELTLGSLLYDSLGYLHSTPWYFWECFGALSMLLLLGASVVSLLRVPAIWPRVYQIDAGH